MCDTTDSHIGVINVCVNLACYKFICWTNNRNFITSYLTPCMLQKVVSYIYVPESSKGLKFEPLNHQKQTWGLKFDTLGGSRYIYIYIHLEPQMTLLLLGVWALFWRVPDLQQILGLGIEA